MPQSEEHVKVSVQAGCGRRALVGSEVTWWPVSSAGSSSLVE